VLDNATGEAKAAIDEEKLNKALDEAKKSEDDKLVELNIKKVQQLPAKFLIKSDAEYKLRIATEQGIIEVPANMRLRC